MITASQPVEAGDVAQHYDELDDLYREIWGEHLHHGLWDGEQDERSVQEASIHLLEELTSPLPFQPGQHFADIGCGYGAPARWLAARHGIHLTALTLSTRQWNRARQATPPARGSVTYLLEDWLKTSLSTHELDGAIAIEVLAHMDDKSLFFQQLHRTLKPKARCAMAVWTIADDVTRAEHLLIQYLCRDGRLAGIGTLNHYQELARTAGLDILSVEDVSSRVERTWRIIARRLLRSFFTRPRYLIFILRRLFRKRLFLFALPAILLVYRTGALRYALVTLEKPPD